MPWVQNYDPAGSMWLSTVGAGLPLAVLLGLLASGFSAPRAALAGLTTALLVATVLFKMPPAAALAAAAYGGCYGLLPIGWIVLMAVFLYDLTVRSGQFEVVKRSVTMISPDRRVQALLIAFAFSTFLEGAAGFGTPVAIAAALLIGIGFSPLYAAGLALIANTSPVAFGGLGIPILTLAKVSGIDAMALSKVAGQQLTLFSLLIPAWLVAVMSGWKGVQGCWPAIVVCGGSFAAVQFVMSNYHGPELVAVTGGIGTLVTMTVFLRFWQPKEIWRFPDERGAPPSGERLPSGKQIAYAWMPWVLLSVLVFLWGSWKEMLNGGSPARPNLIAGISDVMVPVPGLHRRIFRAGPVVAVPEGSDRAAAPEDAVYDFNWLSTSGTSIFFAAALSAWWLRIGPRRFLGELGRTLLRVRWALATIFCMLALAFTTKYSGADATLGLAFTKAGPLVYLFCAPLLGWLGVAITGSDTSANALFGSLQRITAERLKLDPTLIVASNSTGGVMGKMINAQSIVVAAVATEQTGNEGQILRFVLPHSLALVCLLGLLTVLQAYAMR